MKINAMKMKTNTYNSLDNSGKYSKTNLLIAIIIALSLFLTACNSSNNTQANIQVVDVHTGTDALTAAFIKSNPPDTVFIDNKETEFSTMLTLENKGASNINAGYMSLLTEKDYVRFIDDVQNPISFTLEGKSQGNPFGGQLDKAASMAARLAVNSYSKKTQVTAIFCYDYTTDAITQVCIDPDVMNRRVGQKVCAQSDQSLSSQGAPVAITKIETRMVTKESQVIPTFLIYIQNVGKGQVLNPNPAYIRAACTDEPKSADTWNVLNVDATLGNEKLTCEPLPLHLKNKGDFVKCQLASGIDNTISAYTSALQVHLSYGYTSTISKEIELKRTN